MPDSFEAIASRKTLCYIRIEPDLSVLAAGLRPDLERKCRELLFGEAGNALPPIFVIPLQENEAGFSAILRPDGELEVRTPEGALLPTHPALATDRPIVEWDAGADQWHGDRDDPEVDEWTTMPSWDGERMDLGWGVGTLV